jgi:hypothetical protein
MQQAVLQLLVVVKSVLNIYTLDAFLDLVKEIMVD